MIDIRPFKSLGHADHGWLNARHHFSFANYYDPGRMANGTTLRMVTSPVQFDERPGAPTRAPELGEHTEEVLLELGLTWDEITELQERGAI